MYDFEKFPVYILAVQLYSDVLPVLSDKIIPLYLRNQLDRAISSISMNIAEGAGKYSKRDKKNFYIISRGSTNESVSIIRLLRIRGNISNKEFESYYSKLLSISRMLSGLINKMIEK